MRFTLHRPLLIVCWCLFCGPIQAEQVTTSPAPPATTQAAPAAGNTEHELKLGERSLKYQASADFVALKDAEGKLRAKVFYVAYEKAPAEESPRSRRPITFVFNGGPGAASVWLHLGTAGPKRIVLAKDGSIPAPPYRLEDNECTWLDFTDLVFIDPVGTGYSRAEGDRAKEFYSVQGDVASVADVIRLYLTDRGRWSSPKFLAGESYGTTRAAALSEFLHDRYGIDVNGITLISTVLNFQTLAFSPGNDTPYPLWLPSYTAVAWYHKKLPADLQQTDLPTLLAESEKWALEQYMPALMKGSSLDEPTRQQIAQQLSRHTGLPLDYVDKAHLKVQPGRFEKALLNDQRRIIGRMDGRLTGHDPDPLGDSPEYDPSLTGYVGVFSGCFNDYVRRELKFESDLPYEFLISTFAPDAGEHGGYLDVAPPLLSAMTKMPAMKVTICSGRYDLATPFAAADYTVDQMALGRELRKNITQNYYEGGHMLYLNHPALVKLHDDLNEFYKSAAPAPRPVEEE